MRINTAREKLHTAHENTLCVGAQAMNTAGERIHTAHESTRVFVIVRSRITLRGCTGKMCCRREIGYCTWDYACVCSSAEWNRFVWVHMHVRGIGWLRLVGSLKLWVFFAKAACKRDLYSPKRRVIFEEPTNCSHPIGRWIGERLCGQIQSCLGGCR